MAHRIEVELKKDMRDPLGEKIKKRIQSDLNLSVESLRTVSVFTLDMDLSSEDLNKVATGPFLDPVIQQFSIDTPLARDFDWMVEVGFKPGVTDNVGKTAKEAIEWRLGRKLEDEEKVYTSTQYIFRGNLDREEIETISTGLLGNPLIQRFDVWKGDEWRGNIQAKVPKVKGDEQVRVEEIDLEIEDTGLVPVEPGAASGTRPPGDGGDSRLFPEPRHGRAPEETRAWEEGHRCGTGVSCPDLVRTLQAQDLQCPD